MPPEPPGSRITLVSGGAAGADHLAVLLASELGYPLELHLPCPWDPEKKAYRDSGERNWRTNPGGTSNHYHRLFSKACFQGVENRSLEHIDQALKSPSVRAIVGSGFFERNSEVAKADRILAFTFGPGETPADGGTLDTWKKARALGRDCLHISLAGV